MSSNFLSDATLLEAVESLEKYGDTSKAAKATGIPRTTLQRRIATAIQRGLYKTNAPYNMPIGDPLPDPDLPIESIVAHRKAAFERKHAHHQAKRWRKYRIPTSGPYALMFFGDPHLDDDGCHLPLWEQHVDLAASTENLFAINIGDTTNNWAGRLARLWAAHNFKGNSIWNNLHGLERAAQMQDWAHLYVAGHHHDTGLRQGENPHRGFVYNLMRVRGYKYMDDYADHHGFGEHQYGAAGVAVVDPAGDKLNKVTCFLDPFEAVDFLQFKRRNYEG